MAIKKSELYSSLWASCDALRGGMDASQYKDYVLILLFIKYVSDKYAGKTDELLDIPKGGSFKDIVALKGTKDIGEKIDTAIGALAKANDLENVIDVISFNDEEKLGKGKEMIDKLSNLVAIFENPALDFSKNRAEGDDILGDAYEYLMRHFATDSGKSKGQFYTPSEVSRVLAKVLGIKTTTSNTSFYDPTCGSASLLLKVIDEADGKGTLYGQEKDVTTAALARMNMILHGHPTAQITKGQSTLSHPLFLNEHGYLKTFDYCVSNPPFSLVNWTDGFDPRNDEQSRFTGYSLPPEKNGDFAFLLHIVKSLKSKGKGAIILPHGVLFRGGTEGSIRKTLIEKGLIKGIIGLPANLFYGTGIPACIIVIDKENAEATKDWTDDKKGIFLIDASKGFKKEGNKNELREQDIHKIVDVFNKQLPVKGYSRFVAVQEIANEKNDYNLNIPRYIESQEIEDIQDIEAHLLGDIPNADIDGLNEYWEAYPSLRTELFGKSKRANYCALKMPKERIKQYIFTHREFVAFSKRMDKIFADWSTRNSLALKQLKKGFKPKQVIHQVAESLLQTYSGLALLDKYDVYQHLMVFWNETMQDDCYLIAVDGWVAEPYRVLVKNKQGKEVDKGWACDLVPAYLVINRYFARDKKAIEKLQGNKETLEARLTELVEENSSEGGLFAELEKVNKAVVEKLLRELNAKTLKTLKPEKVMSMAAEPEVYYGKPDNELGQLNLYIKLTDEIGDLNKQIKTAQEKLDNEVLMYYKQLDKDEIKDLVVHDKWMGSIERAIKTEMEHITQRLTQRIKELAERYETTLPLQTNAVNVQEEKVIAHLKKMGFIWQ